MNGFTQALSQAQWKVVCKVADIPVDGVHMVQRGLAWQDLPGVELHRTGAGVVYAVLSGLPERHYAVLVDAGEVYMDVTELNAPASRAEAALLGSFAVAPQVV